MKTILAASLLTVALLQAAELHVSPGGNDTGSGAKDSPFRTIQHAAEAAQPGDVITVHAGVYRERINPPRGGTSDAMHIIYQAAPGENAVITGSEPVKGWVKDQNDTWRVTLPNTLFGAFNPYSDILKGDWCRNPGGYHTGAVYLNGDWLTETRKQEDVMQPAADKRLWFAIVDAANTTLWAQFPSVDPNEQDVEINVRKTVFYPDQPGRNFITVRGFTLRHAATPWAPPTAEQIGLIGTHWSKGWIIENNTISHSFSSGVALGKHGDTFDNTSANSAGAYVKTIERAQAFIIPWTKENIGHHIVRDNHISHCEQAGIVGSLGCSFSTVTGNTIHDIHVRRMFVGEEMGGIKFHGAIDTLIGGNHIYRCNRGIWLDWMAQGARVTGNLLHDNASPQVDWPAKWEALVSGGEQDMFLEVNHGPILVDNNIFLSPYSVNDRSQGVAFVHNLFAGVFRIVPHDGRMTPYHKPHSTEVVALHNHPCGDHRIHNNIFVERPDLSGFDVAKTLVSMQGNVYLQGAKPSKHEAHPLVLNQADLELRIEQVSNEWNLTFAGDSAWREAAKPKLVTTESLGNALVPNQPFTNPDGSPLKIDTDYFGKKRDSANPMPGPIETMGTEPITLMTALLKQRQEEAKESSPDSAKDMASFEQAAAGKWREVFSDPGTADWKQRWFLDGEVGTVKTGPNGMELTAGPEFKNDAHHMVLWTKDSFKGDLKIEFEYTRLDEAKSCVTILYIQATGSGLGPYVKDISRWNELRKVPAMNMYFDHMNTYHISYAAFDQKNDDTSYVRGRRYMPGHKGLKDTDLKPDYFPTGFFRTGVPHKITVVKKARDLFVRIGNAKQTLHCHMANPSLPEVTDGRIGLRHMFTRSARYRNFRVSVPQNEN